MMTNMNIDFFVDFRFVLWVNNMYSSANTHLIDMRISL